MIKSLCVDEFFTFLQQLRAISPALIFRENTQQQDAILLHQRKTNVFSFFLNSFNSALIKIQFTLKGSKVNWNTWKALLENLVNAFFHDNSPLIQPDLSLKQWTVR